MLFLCAGTELADAAPSAGVWMQKRQLAEQLSRSASCCLMFVLGLNGAITRKGCVMAARLNRRHQDFVRDKIQATQLIKRLTNHALGELELTQTQIRAIEILLNKSVPNLSSVELSGNEDNPVHTVTRVELVPLSDNGED